MLSVPFCVVCYIHGRWLLLPIVPTGISPNFLPCLIFLKNYSNLFYHNLLHINMVLNPTGPLKQIFFVVTRIHWNQSKTVTRLMLHWFSKSISLSKSWNPYSNFISNLSSKFLVSSSVPPDGHLSLWLFLIFLTPTHRVNVICHRKYCSRFRTHTSLKFFVVFRCVLYYIVFSLHNLVGHTHASVNCFIVKLLLFILNTAAHTHSYSLFYCCV